MNCRLIQYFSMFHTMHGVAHIQALEVMVHVIDKA